MALIQAGKQVCAGSSQSEGSKSCEEKGLPFYTGKDSRSQMELAESAHM